jgi:glycosyltransferase involved in cell wall biosynthesis
MRIGFDATSIRRERSGIGHYSASLLQALSALYPQHEFLVLSHLGGLAPRGSNLVSTQRRAFPIKEIWLQFWLPVILARRQPDLCHFTNSIAPLLPQVPYVLSVHDLSLVRHPEWHPRTRRLWMRRLMRPSILRARHILCNSKATREDLLDWLRLDESKVSVAPLGVRSIFRETRSEEQKAAVRKKYGLARPFFLYVGNIEPRKNLSLLLHAFRKLNCSGIDLVLAGKPAWLWQGIVNDLADLGAAGKAHLLGYVPDEDLPALYQSALAFVYPTRMEGFGLPVLEAMASALPVVTSRIEPLVSLVGDSGWLADPNDSVEWQESLEEAYRDDRKRAALAERARERAGEYTWERTARGTMACYEKALAS